MNNNQENETLSPSRSYSIWDKINTRDLTKLSAIFQCLIGSLNLMVHIYKRCSLTFNSPAYIITIGGILTIVSSVFIYIYMENDSKRMRTLSLYSLLLSLFVTNISMFLFLHPKFTISIVTQVVSSFMISESLPFCVLSLVIISMQYYSLMFHIFLIWFLF